MNESVIEILILIVYTYILGIVIGRITNQTFKESLLSTTPTAIIVILVWLVLKSIGIDL